MMLLRALPNWRPHERMLELARPLHIDYIGV